LPRGQSQPGKDPAGKSLLLKKKGLDPLLPKLFGDLWARGAGDKLAWRQGGVAWCKGDAAGGTPLFSA